MEWARTRYGSPVILYHWIVGVAGTILLVYCTLRPPFPVQEIPLLPYFIFFVMHVVASFLHFQYARLNVVITFESSFTTATLLVFGGLPAVWVSVIGIIIGSSKRVIERRVIWRKPIPLSYDLGIILFNCGMVATMWLAGAWAYLHTTEHSVPLTALSLARIGAVIIMFLTVSAINHVILYASSYLQGQNAWTFLKKALVPAFITEFAIVPFGVVMALSYATMGTLAFFFLGSTLLLSNAVLRNLSIIRYDQEEKLRQLTALNTISREVISIRDEEAVSRLLNQEVGKLVEGHDFFIAKTTDEGKHISFVSNPIDPKSALGKMVRNVAATGQPVLIRNTRKSAPDNFRDELLKQGVRSCILIPMTANDKVYGVLGAYSGEASTFKEEHMQVLIMISDEAALALENSKLYRALTGKIDELEQLNKELRQVDRIKTEFLANVSHELRTPLTSIKGYVDYIFKEKLGPVTRAQSEGLTVAQRNIHRLQRLINDLLDYTKLEFKKTPLQLGPCPLERVWTDVYDQYAESISKKSITMNVSMPPDLPLLYVDSEKYVQLLMNLISNAIKFTPDDGSIWVEAKALTIAHRPNFFKEDLYRESCMTEALVPVELTIRDNGVGIPQEAIPKIFERFYQVDSSNTRQYGGTGLGLALVKSILEAHGNPIQVQSVLGEGTTFTIIVPGIQTADISNALKPVPVRSHSIPHYLT